mmetsp:Transcript_81046/g.159104  ORF Transcript_81046/g.159104 Transcript_81046/m.159104 type:complete len:689 (+) Transcript_81046:3-2069(+)
MMPISSSPSTPPASASASVLASPAARLSSKQKLRTPSQRIDEVAHVSLTPAPIISYTANPFSPPPPPAPLDTPPPVSSLVSELHTQNNSNNNINNNLTNGGQVQSPSHSPVQASIIPRDMTPAAVELQVRVLEYMDACRHDKSPSENISPNSPQLGSERKSPILTHTTQTSTPTNTSTNANLNKQQQHKSPKSSPRQLTVQTTQQSPYLVPDEAIANAVLASKRAIDLATDEIIKRYSPNKKTPPSLSPALFNESISNTLHTALMEAYELSPKSSPQNTPSRPSMLPQRTRGSSAFGFGTTDIMPASSNSENKSKMSNSSNGSRNAPEQEQSAEESSEQRNVSRKSTPMSKSSSLQKKTPPSASTTPFVRTPSSAPSKGAVYVPSLEGARTVFTSPGPPAVAEALGRNDKPRDMLWLLDHLKPSTPLQLRVEASKELKVRIKSAEDVYWMQNYAQFVTVLLESFRVPSSTAVGKTSVSSGASEGPLIGFEHQELSAKSLLVMARYRGNHLKNLLEVMVDRLCHAAASNPLPIVQSFEVILSEFAKYDASRLTRALMPYASFSLLEDNNNNNEGSNNSGVSGTMIMGDSPPARLLALRVISNSVRFFSSAQLLQQLPSLAPVVLSSINSSLADLRKAVVFILVEMYLSVGDSVFPYITSLTPPQRKLMTIYVEKRMNERKNIAATALQN